jgi:hypothetical protein
MFKPEAGGNESSEGDRDAVKGDGGDAPYCASASSAEAGIRNKFIQMPPQ